MRHLLAFLLLCLAALAAFAQEKTPCQPTVTGTLEIFPFASKTFQNTRQLRVWLPAGYNEPANQARTYPALYMLDAQNLFDACTSEVSHREWQVDETLTRLIAEGKVPPVIVVGIDHAGARRAYEYLPYPDTFSDGNWEEPAGKKFPAFLGQEVIPAMEAKYRIDKSPEHRAIGGSSYGGVAALYAILTHPVLFLGGAIIESPSLQVWNAQLLRDSRDLGLVPRKVFIGYGGRESQNPEIQRAMEKGVHLLEANLKGALVPAGEIKTVVDPEAVHNEDAWAKRFPEAVELLFSLAKK